MASHILRLPLPARHDEDVLGRVLAVGEDMGMGAGHGVGLRNLTLLARKGGPDAFPV